MKRDALIIAMAYPDTFVSVSQEFICKVLPYIGVGTKEYLKAGHAALVLINKTDGKAYYFDFGRYITPFGTGRVRTAKTDVELQLPLTAKFDENENLLNLEDFLLYLEANPEKTHGKGRLIASVSDGIYFQSALNYVEALQKMGSIPYGGFLKNGSNCSRFVTETLYYGTTVEKVKTGMAKIKRFTPSPLGNVDYGNTFGDIYEVEHGQIKPYKRSIIWHNLENFFDRHNPEWHLPKPEKKSPCPEAQFLGGVGCGAWFWLSRFDAVENLYRIKRYNEAGEEDFDGIFTVNQTDFDIAQEFTFVYDSHCLYAHVKQKHRIYRFDFFNFTSTQTLINSVQKVRSA